MFEKDESYEDQPIFCLVTGAAGFIGSHLTKWLRMFKHHFVIGYDDMSNGTLSNVEYGDANVFIRGDFTDLTSVNDLFSTYPITHVFHLGALPRVQFSIAEPLKSNRANIDGTLNLLLAARDKKVKRFVYSSSSSVYGDQVTLPLVETMKPNPLSPYALQKLTGEIYAQQFFKIWGLPTVCLRYFNVFGERQRADSSYAAAIPKFTYQLLRGKSPTVFGDGDQTRDFTTISDVVRANMAAAYSMNERVFGEVFNIGGGNRISINEIISKLQTMTGSNQLAEYLPAVIESRHTQADISKAKDLLTWYPGTTFDDGLYATVNWIRESLNVNS